MADPTTLALGIDASGAAKGARDYSAAVDKIISAGKTGADSATKFTKALSDIPNTTAGFADRFAAFNAETERLKAAAASAASASKELGTQLQDVGAKASSATPKVAGMHSGLLGFIGGIGAGVSQQILSFFLQLPSEIIATSDAYQRLDARLGMVTKGMATASEAHAALLDVTTRTHQPLQQTGEFFARIAAQSKELGLGFNDLVALTENLQLAFRASGQSGAETSAVMLQLSQAFAKGRLDGDEFRTLMEGAPTVMNMLTEALGVTKAELFDLSKEGRITGEVIGVVMLNATQQLKAESYAMGTTVAEAVVGIKNAWNEAVETFVKATDANTELVNRLEKISEWIRSDGIDAIASLAGGILAFVDALQKAIDQAKPFADMLNSIAAAAQSAGVAVNQAFGGTGGPVAAAKRGATGTWGLPEGQAVETLSAPGTKATKPGTLQQSPWDIVKAPQGEFGSMVQKRPVVLGPPTEKKGGAKGKKDEKIPLDSKPFEDELTKLNQLMEESTTKTQRDAKALFDNLTKANLQAKGDQVKLIEMTRDKEMDAINLAALSAEDKAKARVMVEETTSAQIIAIRQRETDQSKSLLASLEEASLRSHGQTTAAEKVASAERKRSALSAIEQNKALSPADKTTAKAYVEDINREKTAMEQAGLTLQQFGEGLTGVEGMTQGVIQGLASIGSTATSAFADAIVEGGNFNDMLESLAKSLEKMLIQMTLQMAMQQALGAGASGLAGLMLGPQAGAGGPVASQQGAGGSAGLGGGLFGGGGSGFFAKGGVIQAPLGSGVYVHPTYFESAPLRKFAAGGHMEASLPHGVYITPTVFETKQPGVQRFARGVGLLGEAGPEAVLPLTRSSSGELGIRAKSADPIYNESILPISRLSDGVLGVRTPIQRLAAGAHIEAALPHGVYTRPTLFEMQPSGFHPFAKGTGMLGEAGPEAVLPLTRTSGGELGVRAGGGTAVSVPVNVVVNNSSSAKVFTEQHENQSGGKDIVLTIADQVEGLVASRMARSGSRVSRAVGQVGAVNAR